MTRIIKLAGIAALVTFAGGWFAFRPEKAFIDQKVSEKAIAESTTLRTGSFASYAHETVGTAALIQAKEESLIRLTGFKTSNGPDVHLYLVEGDDPQATQKGFIDLGTLKGNVGDQNYAIPAGTDLSRYGAVAVWCKRFNVGFGGAALPAPKVASLNPAAFRLAAYSPDIVVTRGKLGKGEAAIVEVDGKRFLRVTRAVRGAHVLLVKAETIPNDATVRASTKIDLGVAKGGTQSFPISKEIDVWLYRSVSLWNGKRSLATAHLRSDQERQSFVPSTLWV